MHPLKSLENGLSLDHSGAGRMIHAQVLLDGVIERSRHKNGVNQTTQMFPYIHVIEERGMTAAHYMPHVEETSDTTDC